MASIKSFKGSNPALQFISKPAEEVKTPGNLPLQVQEYQRPETKSRRLNLLFKPSTLAALQKIAALRYTSVNDLLNSMAEDYITAHAQDIATYEQVEQMKKERSNNDD